jgi:tetratricopeptide (TPR) repeat protein
MKVDDIAVNAPPDGSTNAILNPRKHEQSLPGGFRTSPGPNGDAVKERGVSRIPFCATLGNLEASLALFKERDYQRAWELTLYAIDVRPFNPEAYLLLARIACATGDEVSARSCARYAVDLVPSWKAARRFLPKATGRAGKPAWLVLPSRLAKPRSNLTPQLTLCLIARNEERFLSQCLSSVKNLVSQIVLVDTGSSDRTIQIALEHGAEVHHFEWCNDFSAARNASLEHARGDWVLILDADEVLPPEEHNQVRQHLLQKETIAFRLPLVNHGCEKEGRSYVPRLFRNAPGVYFRHRIHEQVFASLVPLGKEWGMASGLGKARLVHYGYAEEVLRERRKVERNLELLRVAVEECPEDVNLIMNLGLELVRSGELLRGLDYYNKALTYACRAPAGVSPELREILLTQYSTFLRRAQNHTQIVEVLTSPLARTHGLTATMHFLLGVAYFKLMRHADAAKELRSCLAKLDHPTLAAINPEIRTALPHHCLATCLFLEGDAAGAEKEFQKGLAMEERQADLRLDYSRFLKTQGRPLEALQHLHELVTANAANAAAWRLGGEIALSRPEFLEFGQEWTAEASKQLPEDPVILAHRAEAMLLNDLTAAALEVYQRLVSQDRQVVALAGLIMCQVAVGLEPQSPQDPQEASQISRAFVGWYRKLLVFGARQIVLGVNGHLPELDRVLPEAARVLESALAEARQHQQPEACCGQA